MKSLLKILLVIACVTGGVASFVYLTLRNRDTLGEYYAKSSVNVEIDRRYAGNVAAAIETSPDPCAYWMSPTTSPEDAETVVTHVSIPLKRPWWNLALRFPQETADAALAAIDNVTVFIGNKVFYFSHDDAQNFRREDRDGCTLFYVPGLFYTKSLVYRNWSNYYGDLNLGVKALSAFFIYPGRFVPTWLCLILLLWLCRKGLASLCEKALAHKRLFAILGIAAVTFAGFVLRWNGYVRHSAWTDEIYSAVRTGNPNLPLASVLTDPGQPPFYALLLRLWFTVLGWNEESGTMLSVVLGTLAIPALYCLIKPYLGKKAALLGALFVAVSGFSIGYSHEMRGYILEMLLAPLAAAALLKFTQKPSAGNLVLYTLPAICIANTHYYGILFVMANFAFFVIYALWNKAWRWKTFFLFCAGNAAAALSFMPFFLYQLLYAGYDFSRDFAPQAGHALLFVVLAVFAGAFLFFRKEIAQRNRGLGVVADTQRPFIAYLILIPAFMFTLAFGISFFKPMIQFRYLWPISAPFCFAFAAALVYCLGTRPRLRLFVPLAAYALIAGLYSLSPDIPSGGVEAYREARAYIAADAAAHPERKSVMLDNAPENARYYGYPVLAAWQPDSDADVLYVYNDIFHMHEMEMYDTLRAHGIDDRNMLKVYFDYLYPRGDGGMVFKKYLGT
jgi:hypothetical protein